MKQLINFSIVALLLVNCSSKNEQFEDQLYSCLENHYKECGIDLETALDSLENNLLAQRILTSKDGQGKIAYYETVVETGQITGHEPSELVDRIAKCYVHLDDLRHAMATTFGVDSLAFEQSEFFKTANKINKQAVINGGVSPVSVSKAMLKHLNAKDFEHPFYRAQMLLSLCMSSDLDDAFRRQIPKKQQPADGDKEIFTIDLTSNKEWLVDGKELSKKELTTVMLQYFENNESTVNVRILLKGSTEYEKLANTQMVIESIYNEFLNQKAQNQYQMPFEKLTTSKQNKLKNEFPLSFIELLRK